MKIKSRVNSALVVVASLVTIGGQSSIARESAADIGEFNFAGDAVVLSLVKEAMHPMVALDFGDGRQYDFIVDTGAGVNVIDISIAESQGYEVVGETEIGAPGGPQIPATIVKVPLVHVGDATIVDAEFVTMDVNAFSGGMTQGVLGVGLFYDAFKWGFKFTKNLSDPTAQHIPFFAPNHEAKLFNTLEEFRFDDGRAFDFRGLAERTADGATGTLADSNQRASKGFAHTYEFVISVGAAGNYKLDWIFVKSYATDPRDEEQSYRFAPHFARTLRTLNYATETKLSDHNPMTVDLPFGEPGDLSREDEE